MVLQVTMVSHKAGCTTSSLRGMCFYLAFDLLLYEHGSSAHNCHIHVTVISVPESVYACKICILLLQPFFFVKQSMKYSVMFLCFSNKFLFLKI
jgi:hypothetical protein